MTILKNYDVKNDGQLPNLKIIYNISKLIYALNLVDEIYVLIMTKDLDSCWEKTKCLRETILYLISFKRFVEKAKEID